MNSAVRSIRGLCVPVVMAAALVPSTAYALGEPGGEAPPTDSGKPSGDADNQNLMASVSTSKIRTTTPSGTSDVPMGELTSVDPNWEPPPCWYEPVFSPEALKAAVANGDGGYVNAHEWWSNGIFVDHYDEGEAQDNFDLKTPTNSTARGYKNYNVGKDGMFWRSVVRKGHESNPKAWDCGKIMFWQNAGTIPVDEHAPTPAILAAFAYDKIRVPDTEVELKPAAKQTVNLPTWMWLDKGTFKDVQVRAELPGTGLWAETTAKPISLHLDPGTKDAELYPASGECTINNDGSIGTPFSKGSADRTPPCGITYLRSTAGQPHQLKASVTWEITWEGSTGPGGIFPNGTFETSQDITVQEIQAINR